LEFREQKNRDIEISKGNDMRRDRTGTIRGGDSQRRAALRENADASVEGRRDIVDSVIGVRKELVIAKIDESRTRKIDETTMKKR
jgi:hypothetical protein